MIFFYKFMVKEDDSGRIIDRRREIMKMLNGSIVALITPFNEDGSVNYTKLTDLVTWHIAKGTDGIVILGTTAESPSLTSEEKDKIVETVIQAADHRIPVIAGSGSNNTMKAKADSLKYEAMGVDGLLVITPYYNKTNKAGMISHFTEIADAVSIPIILYNVPGRTGCSLTFEAVETLSRHRNIVGIKEASGDIGFVSRISKLITQDFALYSGNDDMIVPILSLGGAGVISVLANILPSETHEMVNAYLKGNIELARVLQLKYLDFINALFIETNPIPIKQAMNYIEMDVGGYRLPLCAMEEQSKEQLQKAMIALKLEQEAS